MKKNTKSSTKQELKGKNVFDEFFDFNKMHKVPTDSVYIDNMAAAIISEARRHKDSITMEDIYEHYGILQKEFDRLRKRYPRLDDAYHYAMQCIGNKRFVCAANNKLNWNVINSTQAHYSQIAKEMAEWRASLRNKEDGKATSAEILQDIVAQVLAK